MKIGLCIALLLTLACSTATTSDVDAGQDAIVDLEPDVVCADDAMSVVETGDASSLAIDPCLAYLNQADCESANCDWFTFHRGCSANSEPVHFCSRARQYLSGLYRWIFVRRFDVPTECYVTSYSEPPSPVWKPCTYWAVDQGQCVLRSIVDCERYDSIYGPAAVGQ